MSITRAAGRRATALMGVTLAAMLLTGVEAGAAEPAKHADPILGCSHAGTKVGMTYFRHPDAQKQATAAAVFKGKKAGAEYPVGTIVQLVPNEVMVKRTKAEYPNSNGWEFLVLGIDGQKATVTARGDEAANPLGTCLGCHAGAAQFDYVCGKDHGCAPIPVTDDQIMAFQDQDSRCTVK